MKEREKFGSRLGFILISAGCAIGLGNVWKFPYIVGKYGGAAFVLIYLFFLAVLGVPVLAMEFAAGRASQKSIARSYHTLEPKNTKWHLFSSIGVAGNYILMMFYTTVAGWMVLYCYKTAVGDLNNLPIESANSVIAQQFENVQANPWLMLFCMALVVIISMGICFKGLKNGVEKITKIMMLCLLGLILILAINSITLSGAKEGLEFYFVPNWEAVHNIGWNTVIFEAMGQAFFTLSIGMGSMSIFGSYLSKDRSLMGEAINVTILDTSVAIMAGLIIFPACTTYGVDVGAGPGLIFVALPNVFNAMPLGQLWGTLFFVFMGFAAFSTVIGVFENIISFAIDIKGWSRTKAVLVNLVAIIILSIPCVLGFNVLSGINPLGEGSVILDLEDFIVSNNILPLGSLFLVIFCVSKRGWGWKNFTAEANLGKGLRFPTSKAIFFYCKWILPVMVLYVFIMGYLGKFPQIKEFFVNLF